MSKTIKNNLFRFITLRNPQLIDEKDKDFGFVFHPDEKTSVFFTTIEGVTEEDKQSRLKAASDEFSALQNRTEARLVNDGLYQFSSWLMRHKNDLNFVDIKNNSDNISVLKAQDELLIWDNLMY